MRGGLSPGRNWAFAFPIERAGGCGFWWLWFLAAVLILVVPKLLLVPLGDSTKPGFWENFAYQATMPGIEEEITFRGIFLLLFVAAFGAGKEWLGLRWGWPMLLTTFYFGLVHVISLDNAAAWNWSKFNTAFPGFLLWLVRERRGSVLPAIALHNLMNLSGSLATLLKG